MDYPQLNDIGKPIVRLFDSGGLGLIVLFPSGVVYTNQTGGYSCMTPTEEGIFVPLVSETLDHEKILHDYFFLGKWGGWCNNGIDEKDADFIDELLARDFITKMVSVNRERLHDSHEAWVYVNIGPHPGRFPRLPANYGSEMSFSIYGFGSREGVITWCNSD